jgi:hypothetical protein
MEVRLTACVEFGTGHLAITLFQLFHLIFASLCDCLHDRSWCTYRRILHNHGRTCRARKMSTRRHDLRFVHSSHTSHHHSPAAMSVAYTRGPALG